MLRILCTLMLSATLASAGIPGTEPATGTIGPDCDGITLRLQGLPNQEHATLLYIGAGYSRDHWKPPLHQAVDFYGHICSTPEQCVKGPSLQVMVSFDQFDAKEAAGTYTETHPDGSTQTGSFRVKHLKRAKHYICE